MSQLNCVFHLRIPQGGTSVQRPQGQKLHSKHSQVLPSLLPHTSDSFPFSNVIFLKMQIRIAIGWIPVILWNIYYVTNKPCCSLFMYNIYVYHIFWDKVSLGTSVWPGIYYADKVAIKLTTVLLLPLPWVEGPDPHNIFPLSFRLAFMPVSYWICSTILSLVLLAHVLWSATLTDICPWVLPGLCLPLRFWDSFSGLDHASFWFLHRSSVTQFPT